MDGAQIPNVELRSAAHGRIDMHFITRNAAVVYFYTGALGWPVDARDKAQARGFRDHYTQLLLRGYHVIGVHAQGPDRQLHHMMDGVQHFLAADPELCLADALGLPTYKDGGTRVYRRLTLVVERSRVVHTFYPVASPGRSAWQVLHWLDRSRAHGALPR